MSTHNFVTTHPHEMDDDLFEKLIDFYILDLKSNKRDDPIRSREFLIKEARIKPNVKDRQLRCFAMIDDEIVGSCYAGYTVRENDPNPDSMWVNVTVLPEHRRKGLGTQLFDRIIEFARKVNRLKLDGGLYPIDGDGGPKFLENMGIEAKMNEKVSRLYKEAINWDLVATKEREYNESMSKFKLLSLDSLEWANKVLNDEDFASRYADFMTEAINLLPREEIEQNDELFNLDDVRRWAENTVKTSELWSSRSLYLLDGEKIIAMSGTHYPNDPPIEDVGTGLTAVRKAYHRMGIATYLKIKMLRYYTESHPEFKYISTENAASNEGMLAINVALGFKPVYDWKMYQHKIEP